MSLKERKNKNPWRAPVTLPHKPSSQTQGKASCFLLQAGPLNLLDTEQLSYLAE